jgi:hypothetical protein
MADNIRTVAVRTVQDLDNHDTTQASWGGSASEMFIEPSTSTLLRHLRRLLVAEALHQDVEDMIVLIPYESEWWETML